MSSTSSPSSNPFRIEPLGDQALVIELGQTIDEAVNRRVCALASSIALARIAGVVDVVASFTSVGVHYRAVDIGRLAGESPRAALVRQLGPLLAATAKRLPVDRSPVVEIPVCYGGDHGPDLEEAAERCGIAPDRLIALHQQAEGLRVHMIGFAPGAPYIGLLDSRLSLPRRATPRLQVAAGSVAIANRQSVIYPFAAPGGWNLIGRTPLVLFDAARHPPGLLHPGTRVRFRAIDESEYAAWPKASS